MGSGENIAIMSFKENNINIVVLADIIAFIGFIVRMRSLSTVQWGGGVQCSAIHSSAAECSTVQ